MKFLSTLFAAMILVVISYQTHVAAAPAIVEEAKAQCIVGEQMNGYLGVVPGKTVSVELQREIRRINQQRKILYTKLAEENGVTVKDIEALTAQKLISRAQPGECVRGSDNEWVKK